MSDQVKTLSEKLTSIQKIVITTIAIIGAVWVAGWQAVEAIDSRAVARQEAEKNHLIDMGFLTTDEFVDINKMVQDSLSHIAQFNREALNYTLNGQAINYAVIKRTLKNDSTLDGRLNGIKIILDSIRGVSEVSVRYQNLLHQRDSALSVALHIENQIQEQLTIDKIMRENEDNLDRIEERIKSEKKNKIINVKHRQPKRKQEFQERIIFGGNQK
jgi:hypothetical protein